MIHSIKAIIGITYLSTYQILLFSQGFKIDTDHGTEFIPDKMIVTMVAIGQKLRNLKANIQKFSQYIME